jgi:hypothetical protein
MGLPGHVAINEGEVQPYFAAFTPGNPNKHGLSPRTGYSELQQYQGFNPSRLRRLGWVVVAVFA